MNAKKTSDLAAAPEIPAGEEVVPSTAFAREIGTTPGSLRVKRATSGELYGVPLPKGRRTPNGLWVYTRSEVDDYKRRAFGVEATTTAEASRKESRQQGAG